MTDFKYADSWNTKAKLTLKILPRCVKCLNKASIVHHLHYSRSPLRRVLGLLILHSPKESIAGYEIPLFDLVPLCSNCHENAWGLSSNSKSVHYTKRWVQKKHDSIHNHQKFFFAWRLRIFAFGLALLRWLFFRTNKKSRKS